MDMTTPMKHKPLVNATCKLGEKGCFKDGRCHALGDCENKVVTNGDKIRAMTDEELAEKLIFWNEDWGRYETDAGFFDGDVLDKKLYAKVVKAEMEWLRQPAEVDG